eukprot:7056318-Pyramimonas_sp.AAC.1
MLVSGQGSPASTTQGQQTAVPSGASFWRRGPCGAGASVQTRCDWALEHRPGHLASLELRGADARATAGGRVDIPGL